MDPTPEHDGANIRRSGGLNRQEWVRANFTRIFGTSAQDLMAQGIDPRRYAREHRDQIRQFAQQQRRQGVAVPSGRPSDGAGPADNRSALGVPSQRGYEYRGGRRLGMGARGGTAWIGILIALLALRFILVDSLVGAHAAILWVLVIGGIVLAARVLLLSWLRKRRWGHRQPRGHEK